MFITPKQKVVHDPIFDSPSVHHAQKHVPTPTVIPGFECGILSKLRRKPYLHGVDLSKYVKDVNVLLVGCERTLELMSKPCRTIASRPGFATREELLCGEDTRVLLSDATTHLGDQEPFKTEFRLRCEGRLGFSAEAVESVNGGDSVFSSSSSNVRFHTSPADVRNRPHVVLVNERQPGWIAEIAKEHDIPVFRLDEQAPGLVFLISQVRHFLIQQRILTSLSLPPNASASNYERGYQSGARTGETELQQNERKAVELGKHKGIADARFVQALVGTGVEPIKQAGLSQFPENLKCSLTGDPIRVPAITKFGHTYEDAALRKLLTWTHRDPVTQEKITPQTDIVYNQLYADLFRFYSSILGMR